MLFDLLCRAYVDAQYKKEFSITKGQLEVLGERVEDLMGVCEMLCLAKIEAFVGRVLVCGFGVFLGSARGVCGGIPLRGLSVTVQFLHLDQA